MKIGKDTYKASSLLDVKTAILFPKKKLKFRYLRKIKGFMPQAEKSALKGFLISHNRLNSKNANWLVEQTMHDIERFDLAWSSLEDTFLVSTPELMENPAPVRSLHRWFFNSLRSKGLAKTIKIHKKWVQWFYHRATRTKTFENPPFPLGGWRCDNAIYSLEATGIKWIDSANRGKIIHKDQAFRLACLVSTRGFPTGDKEESTTSLDKHYKTLHLPGVEVSKSWYDTLRESAKTIGIESAEAEPFPKNYEHLSVTNSSCQENTRSEGGRAFFVHLCYHEWALSVPDEDRTFLGYLGKEIQYKKGVPKWKTVLDSDIPHERSEEVEFGELLQSGNFPQYAGFDSQTGYQITQCAAEYLIEIGIFDSDYNIIGVPEAGRSTINEGGFKSRIVTKDKWAITVLLQPMSHLLSGVMKHHRFARAGMSRAYQHFEWVKGFDQKPMTKRRRDELKFLSLLTSDMETATDYCDFQISKVLLEGFAEGARVSSPYVSRAIDLLVSQYP
jgi:hypothetical protein